MLISWNVEYGPDLEEARYQQVRTCLKRVYETKTPSQCPLFVEYAPLMIEELESNDAVQFPRLKPVDEELWDFLAVREQMVRNGRRTSMCRFGAPIAKMKKFKGWWTVHLFERALVTLELDMMHGKRLTEKLILKPGGAERGG